MPSRQSRRPDGVPASSSPRTLTELNPVGDAGVLPGLRHGHPESADGAVGGAQRRLAGGCQRTGGVSDPVAGGHVDTGGCDR